MAEKNETVELAPEKEFEIDPSLGYYRSERSDKAMKRHHAKHNCAQAISCSYSDIFGVEENDAFRATEAFGFGMGTMSTCGSITCMAYLAGLKNSSGDIDDPSTKTSTYRLIKLLTREFVLKNGTTLCRELKGVGTGKEIRSCDGCISDACEIIERLLLASDETIAEALVNMKAAEAAEKAAKAAAKAEAEAKAAKASWVASEAETGQKGN